MNKQHRCKVLKVTLQVVFVIVFVLTGWRLLPQGGRGVDAQAGVPCELADMGRPGNKSQGDHRRGQESSPRASAARQRMFSFTYAAKVTGLAPGATARIWLPVPPSNVEQQVTVAETKLPAKGQFGKEAKFGNQMVYVEAKADAAGTVPLTMKYCVARNEVIAGTPIEAAAQKRLAMYLEPNARVPVDGKPLELVRGLAIPSEQVELGRMLYEIVNGHMQYSKEGAGWGQGDAAWACDSKYGNCSDFHSLFISLARGHKLPAQFEIGFPLPDERGAGDIAGYHCWAKFSPDGKTWVPVDISEGDKHPELKEYYFGNLTESRITFSVGRDLVLSPKQDGPPVNFFIYPYVEVDGKAYPAEKIERHFAFRDLGF